MTISEVSIKKLWARSAGRCAYPDCGANCARFLAKDTEIIVGEMAHVIASSPNGPRGVAGGGSDDYENLVLLCPTHHRTVDKAPEGTFPAEELHSWKSNLEALVEQSLQAPVFMSRKELNQAVKRRLIENHVCWRTFGPEGDVAKNNKNSEAGNIWTFRKLGLIIPNNRYLINVIQNNFNLFTNEEYAICCSFIEHAEAFDKASLEPMEDVPRFPTNFDGIFNG